MNKLFEDLETIKEEKSLKITAKTKQKLSKKQLMFNQYTTRIENLRKEIIIEEEKLNRLLNYYHKKIEPCYKELGEARIRIAQTLAVKTQVMKFTKKQIDEIADAISQLCLDAFDVIEPLPEYIMLFDNWSSYSYDEFLHAQEHVAMSMMNDFIKQTTGQDVDFKEFKDSPEKFKEFEETLRKLEEEEAEELTNAKSKKKNKKQIEIEMKQKQEEMIKDRSLRSIYIGLAKVLHPDTELDIELKLEKEELMKKVTTAYNNKELSTLLKLELEWVAKESDHLDKMTEEKLDIYLSFLKEQVKELDNEKKSLREHPRYSSIEKVASLNEKTALRNLNRDYNLIKNSQKDFLELEKELKFASSKKVVLNFVKDYLMLQKAKEFESLLGSLSGMMDDDEEFDFFSVFK